MSKTLGTKVDLLLYKRFSERAIRERMTVSDLLRKAVNEFLSEKKPLPSDKTFILRESIKILDDAYARIERMLSMMERDKILEYLKLQIRDMQTKLMYEEKGR